MRATTGEKERESKFIGGNTMEHRGGVPQRKFMIQHYLEVLYTLERASTTKKMRSELNYKVGEVRSEETSGMEGEHWEHRDVVR